MTAPLQNVTAAILAGGLGTRLRPVVADRPKVLAPVGGKTYLAHLLDQLARAGVTETVLLVGYGADQVRAAFPDDLAGMRLHYSTESEPLGTGGAVRLALAHFREPTVLLLNGDSYCDVDLAAFLAFHRRTGAVASLALAEVPDTSRYGRVKRNGDRVIGFEEKGGSTAPGWINAGIYLIRRDAVAGLPPSQSLSLERDILPAWVASGGVRGFPGGRFIDIGTPESYAAAETFFQSFNPAACRD